LSWLLMEGSLLVLFLYFGSSAAAAVALMLLAIPLLTLPVNLYISKRIELIPEAAVNLKKGEAAAVCVQLYNPAIFPVFHVKCKLIAENQLNGQTALIQTVTWLPARKKQSAAVRIGSDYCGRIKLSVEDLRLYDCFGVFGLTKKCRTATHITVQPDTFEIDLVLNAAARFMDESDSYSQDKAGDDLSEIYQIREYVPGDSPRQVHWKLSNKFDRLIVKEPALPLTKRVLVFWERTGDSGDLRRIDAQAEVIVSLCKNLLDQSIPFTIGWNDTDRNLCVLHDVQDMDRFVAVVARLMRARGVKEGISGAELLVQTRPEALCSSMIYLAEEAQNQVFQMQNAGTVSVLLCGETPIDGARMFDPEHYEQQLSYIEL